MFGASALRADFSLGIARNKLMHRFHVCFGFHHHLAGRSEQCMVVRAAEVSHATHRPIACAVRSIQFDAAPLTTIKVHASNKAQNAGHVFDDHSVMPKPFKQLGASSME
jgi:hypothetical protein